MVIAGHQNREEQQQREERQRRFLQEYIFNLEQAQDKAEELARAHENLKISQDLLLTVVNFTVQGLCLLRNRTFIWCNKAFSDIVGWEQEKIIGKSTRIVYPNNEEYDRMGEIVYRGMLQEGLIIYEYDLIHKEGHRIPCLVTGSALDRNDLSKGLVFSITDFSDRKQTQVTLKQTLAELEKRTKELELTNIHLSREIEDRKAAEKQLEEYRDHLEELVKERTNELSAVNVQLRQEIAERGHAEEALRRSQNKFKALFELAPEAIFLKNLNGQVLECNLAAEKMTGYSRTELQKRAALDIMPKEAALKFLNIIKSNGGCLKAEFTRKNGEIFPVQACIKSIELDDEKIILVVVHDLSTQEKIEQELLKAQKLESLGILAGGIAHDFNNIMTTVIGNLSLVKMHPAMNRELLGILEEMEKACFGAKDLTQQLLTFAKGGMPVKKTVPITGLIQDSAQFALRGSNVSCEFDLKEDICPVEVDEGQINQVINNLIINADQAMPAGGKVFIQADNIKLNKRQGLPLKPGKYLKLTIKDQGAGIRKRHLGKIFDPYFTTKQQGSGLGLSTAYSIIKNHDGHIEVDSELGVGTSFQIYLPASEKIPNKTEKPKQSPLPGQGKILLMDDQESIRTVMDKMLNQLGYEVTLSRDGTEALELYQKALNLGERFDAVIMDLTIPGGMGGKDAIGRFMEIDPEVKAIVFSGYSNDPLMAEYNKYGFRGVISKPFRIDQLSKTLHEVITKSNFSK